MISVTTIRQGQGGPDETPDWESTCIVIRPDGGDLPMTTIFLSPDDAKHLFAELGEEIKKAEGAWG